MPVYESKLNGIVFPLVLAFCFISLMAQVTIDLPLHDLKIPVTGQSLAVLLVAYILGKRLGVLAILLYLFLGILGAPIFANGAAGFAVLMKGSGGFLYGFIAGAWVAGWFGDKKLGKNIFSGLLAMTLGTLVIIAFGLFHLTLSYGWSKALAYGFYPFWQGALVKIVLGAVLIYLWHRIKD